MPKVVDVLKRLWTWPFMVNDTPDWTKDLRDEFYTKKTNLFGRITFDSTPTKTKLASPTWLAVAILYLFIMALMAVWLTRTSVICYV